MKKKLLSLVLVMSMILSMFPVTALAAPGDWYETFNMYYIATGEIPTSSNKVNVYDFSKQNYGPSGNNVPMAQIRVNMTKLIAESEKTGSAVVYEDNGWGNYVDWYFVPQSVSDADVAAFWNAVLACVEDGDDAGFRSTGLADYFVGYALKRLPGDNDGRYNHLDGTLKVTPPVYVVELYDNGTYFGGAVTDRNTSDPVMMNDVLNDYAEHLKAEVIWTEGANNTYTGSYRSGNSAYSVTVEQTVSGNNLRGDIGYRKQAEAYYLATFNMSPPQEIVLPTYTVTYTDGVNGVELFKNQSTSGLYSGDSTPEFKGTPTRAGYSFTGWNPTPTATVTGDVTYTAQWAANDVGYKIEYYLEDLDGNGYTRYDAATKRESGKTDVSVVVTPADIKSFEGFTYDEGNVNNVLSGVVTADGNLTLKLYYTRNSNYTVTWVDWDYVEGATPLETDVNVRYGATPEYNGGTPTRVSSATTDYTFAGWDRIDPDDGTEDVVILGSNAEKVRGDVIYKATFTDSVRKHTAVVEVHLDAHGDEDSSTPGAGTRVDIEDVSQHRNLYLIEVERDERSNSYKKVSGAEAKPLTRVSEGVYQNADLENGVYQIFASRSASKPVCNQLVIIDGINRVRYLYYHTVEYHMNDGSRDVYSTEHVHESEMAYTIDAVPERDGYRFLGWSFNRNASASDKLYKSGDALTGSTGIADALDLYAQWLEETAVVNLTVVVDHKDNKTPANVDETPQEDMHIVLTRRPSRNSTANYLEVNGSSVYELDGAWYTMQGSPTKVTGVAHADNITTVEFDGIYTNLADEMEYNANVILTGYKQVERIGAAQTGVTSSTDENGITTYEVVVCLQYDPAGFELEYFVTVAEGVDEAYIPKAVNLKITHYNGESWEVIDEHQHDTADVTLDGRSGDGDWHVWGFNSDRDNAPYYYRVEVDSIELKNGTTIDVSNSNGVTYTAGNYTATVKVKGGAAPVAGELEGAYASTEFTNGFHTQIGRIEVDINIETFNVTFDLNDDDGGVAAKFQDGTSDNKTVTGLVAVPNLNNYVPTRDGYVFVGWCKDKDCETPAVSNEALTNHIILYADWQEQSTITIAGTVTVAGSYMLDGNSVAINDADKPDHVYVLIQDRVPGTGHYVTEAWQRVSLVDESGNWIGKGNYSVSGLRSDYEYRIDVLVTNYDTKYQNEPDSLSYVTDYNRYSENAYEAEVKGDTTAVVNAYLEFEPNNFDLLYEVDASEIGDGFRPESVNVYVLYDDGGSYTSYHYWPEISQMEGTDGQKLEPARDGKYYDDGKAPSYPVWQFHPNGHEYDYAIRLASITDSKGSVISPTGVVYTDQPFTVGYTGAPANFVSTDTDPSDGVQDSIIIAKISPRSYPINYVLNAPEGAVVTGVDKLPTRHTWSHVTKVSPEPVCEGYVFAGWTADKSENYDSESGTIPASVWEPVTLTASWKKVSVDVEKTVKAGSNNTVEVGDTIEYNIVVKNTGEAELTNITVKENFGGKIQNAALSLPDGVEEIRGGVYLINALQVGESVTITLTYKVTGNDIGKLSNSVVVEGNYDNGTPEYHSDDTGVSDEDEADDVTVEKDDPYIPPYIPPVDDEPSKPALNKQDHIAYIIGYEDGTVQPQKNITRAEVATIFFRLLTDESRALYWSQDNEYIDVKLTDWFNNAISTLANAEIITGYPDDSFRPNAPITRAEFATIAARFSEVVYNGGNSFVDVPQNHWAARYIALAEYLGWVTGYPDGSFKPDQNITRAEAMTLINRVLERAVEKEHMLADMVTWSDNLPGDWFYEAVQEATNSHTYVRLDKRVSEQTFNYEDWLVILPVPDWAALENAWSSANSD